MIDKLSDNLAKTIKPCKRCGHPPELAKWKNQKYLICVDCMVGSRYSDSVEEAIEVWNKYN